MAATLTYNEEVQFPVSTNSGEDWTHIGFWNALTGGTYFGGASFSNNPQPLQTNERYDIATGQIVFSMSTISGFTDDYGRAVMNSVKSGVTIYVSGHTDDPGTTGAHESTQSWYARQRLIPEHFVVA